MDVNDLKIFVEDIANKWRSGAISPDEYNTFLAAASMEYFKIKIGLPEEYKPGEYLPRQAYQATQKITDDVRNLISKPTLLAKNSDGMFELPPDYGAYSSLSYRKISDSGCGNPHVFDVAIEVVTDGEYQIRKNNSIISPTLDYPIAVFYDGCVSVKPEQVDAVYLTYVRVPRKPFRAYTVVNDVDVYDAANSVQLEWPETTHIDIAYLILKMMGINLRKQDLYQYANNRQIQGQ